MSNKKINFNYNQLSLPFGERGRDFGRSARALLGAGQEERERYFWFLASVSVCALLVYIYAINASAHNIAIRQNLERQVAESRSDLSALEFQAIALKNDITLEVAESHGFKEVSKPLYVSRGSKGTALTLNTVTR